MPLFSYTAIAVTGGRECRGTIESGDASDAVAALKARGLAPLSLAPGATAGERPATFGVELAERGRRWLTRRPVSAKGLAVFTRQLATLLHAGMPLLRGLEVLARQERGAAFRAVIEELAATIRGGGDLSEGLARHPRVFDRLFVAMVKAGEAGGVLHTTLDRLAWFMERAERVRGRVKSAMTYPVIVLVLAAGIVAALLVFVVPRFEQIFAGLLKGQPLPVLTQAVLNVSYFVQGHALLLAGLFAGGYGALVAAGRTRWGVRARDWAAIHQPLLGELFLKAAIARFTRTFGTLLSGGVPILQALTITRETSGNVHIAEAIDRVHVRVKEGDSVARPLEASAIFPPMVAGMINVGEETGALPAMLTRIADAYEQEVDDAVAGLTSVIEPLLIVLLAVVVGTIVIALFLPIVSIIQHLQ